MKEFYCVAISFCNLTVVKYISRVLIAHTLFLANNPWVYDDKKEREIIEKLCLSRLGKLTSQVAVPHLGITDP